ncbi:MAG: hypothetical protein Q7N50_08435 [Armatimonadota bacterium]|nr:hypothetical protein [Armatimonadota bacterium]
MRVEGRESQIKPKIGLLGLYIELYDNALPEVRPRIDGFCATIAEELQERDIDVVTTNICRLESEFEAAIKSFEDTGVDAVVTLHLAYSPSLESAQALAKTKLPIIVLDTTPTYEYGPEQNAAELMYNHGIHGVQDMCNLLIRNGKPFEIESGHWEKSDVLDRIAAWAEAAMAVTAMKTARVGIIGAQFKGMGDFAIPFEVLRSTIGIETIHCDPSVIQSLVPDKDDKAVEDCIASDQVRFMAEDLDLARQRETTRACLGVRRWIEKENLTAFTMNFMQIDKASGLPTVPFLEASKAMADGIGYAGEGDVLTAALVGALMSVFTDTTFTEMFCPDWHGDSIFLNHMGEMNLSLSATKPKLREMDFPWTDAENPIFAVGKFKAGEAVLVNLAPGPNDSYSLIVAPVTMLDIKGKDNMSDLIHGWFRPEMPVGDFLEEYSRAGGTHHLALVYGDVLEQIVRFGMLMGWNVVALGFDLS